MQAKQSRYVAGNAQSTNDWPAIAIQIAAATIFSGVIAYVATNPQQLAHAVAESNVYTPAPVIAPPAPSPAVQSDPEPVRVKNPFDATEVFLFPSGTSETDAHLAVAGLLLQRARDRQHLWAHKDHGSKNRANRAQLDEATAVPASQSQVPVSHSPRLTRAQESCRTTDGAAASEPAAKWKCS